MVACSVVEVSEDLKFKLIFFNEIHRSENR